MGEGMEGFETCWGFGAGGWFVNVRGGGICGDDKNNNNARSRSGFVTYFGKAR